MSQLQPVIVAAHGKAAPRKRVAWDEARVPVDQNHRNPRFELITRGNSKLGAHVWKFSLPVIETCPGATAFCREFCYAKDGWYRRSLLKRIRSENLGIALEPARFEAAMARDLAKARARFFRLHDSGDFFSADYVRSWVEIVRAHPSIAFWAYTRSWSVPDLRADLEVLRALPDMQLFASVDPDSGPAPAGWRLADFDGGGTPGVVCLVQSGHKASCEECGFCLKGINRNVLWHYHGPKADRLDAALSEPATRIDVTPGPTPALSPTGVAESSREELPAAISSHNQIPLPL